MSAESPMSVGPWDTSPLSVHARWPGLRGRILQNKIRENPCSENRAHPAVVRQAARRWRRTTLAATREEHPFSAGRRRRTQSAYRGTRYQTWVPQRSDGSAQHPRRHLRSGGDGFPLRRRSHPGRGLLRRLRRLPRRHETEEARHAPALQPGVSHLEWRLDGCDIVGRADFARCPRPST